METLRQVAGSLLLATISVLLVIGGIFLSLAESYVPKVPTSTQTQAIFPAPMLETPTSQSLVLVTEALSLQNTTVAPPTSCPPPVSWIPVQVKAGDDLVKIAIEYKSTPEQIKAANCLFSNDLTIGSILYLPPQPEKTVISCGKPVEWIQYSVQPGNTLFSISHAYKITVGQLQFANCIPSYQYTIHVGQTLWVPNVTVTQTPFLYATATSTLTPISLFFYTPTYTQTPTNTIIPSATATTQPTSTPTSTTALLTASPTATATVTGFAP